MQNLDILYLPLSGIRLIEASAGTGKTYNLTIIYIRLLLNLNKQSVLSSPLSVKNILVVTFSKSAVWDLRKRIREQIQQFQLDCMRGYSNNNLFSQLLLQINDMNYAIHLLSQAAREINQASIFTIHGFCQKILIENTIELNMLFNVSILEQKNIFYKQICFDFWRRHFYTLPTNTTSFIQQFWKNPEELLQEILPYLNKEIYQYQHFKFINQSNNSITVYYAKIITCIKNIKVHWNEQQTELINFIKQNNFNHRIYNKKNLTLWIETINKWITQPTHDHSIPNNLNRFGSSTLQNNKYYKNFNVFTVCYLIEQLYQQLSSFKFMIYNMVINDIQNYLNINKNIRSEITFDDIIKILLNNGIEKKNNTITQKILAHYPAVIIDEFQDTDFYQYKIFHTLYSNSIENSLTLIGDPKQSIYGFRGADILTYIKIKQKINHKYYLNTNWRSSPGIVNAVNQLFQLPNAFIFPDIPYIPSKVTHNNKMHRFMIRNKPQSAICFWLASENDYITINNYQNVMAQECAITLKKLLYDINNKEIWLENNTHKKSILQISDITILVRNHSEASLIQSELLKQNISTEFLSNRRNIFKTLEAYELLLLLKAILLPKKKSICTALTTIFFGLDAIIIENVYKNQYIWENTLKEFSEYYNIWKTHDILSMIQKILFKYKIPEKLISIKSGKNNLINILHLGELLNDISKQINDENILIQWLEKKINQTQDQDQNTTNYILRSDDSQNCIKISTIHKSKGLEFPITFLPFIAGFKNKKDHTLSESNSTYSNKERLAEDLRLLYVAITRSIYHCSIGIAPIIQYKYNYKRLLHTSDLHLSALGYLIQKKLPATAQSLKQYLKKLSIHSNGDITFRILSNNQIQKKNYNLSNTLNENQKKNLLSKKWHIPYNIQNNLWAITSYSALKQINDKNNNINDTTQLYSNIQKLFNNNLNNDLQENEPQQNLLNTHTFPKGKIYGIFFHDLFKNLDFKKNINTQWLKINMQKYDIHPNWKKPIQQWLYTILNTPLNKYHLTLSKIHNKNKQTEFKFNLLINKCLTPDKLNYLCKSYDSLSYQTTPIDFPDIIGILQGFIDLVFYWNNKYYLLDYKTNWLGINNSFYTHSLMKDNIIKYHYDLQYQLYTIALHRFLQHKISSYNYEKNFGGVYYLFIRGMDGQSYNNGIYFHRPAWKFIKKLNKLLYK